MTVIVYLKQTIKNYRKHDDLILNILKDILECPVNSCSYTYVLKVTKSRKCKVHNHKSKLYEEYFNSENNRPKCPIHNKTLVGMDVIEVEAETSRIYSILEKNDKYLKNNESMIFIYDHEGPSTRFGSFHEDILARYLFQKPVVIVDKNKNRPVEVDLELNPMRNSVENMSKNYYFNSTKDALNFLKETGLYDDRIKKKIDKGKGILAYFSISLRRGYLDEDYRDALKAANRIQNEAEKIGLKLNLYVPNPILGREDGYSQLDSWTKYFLFKKLKKGSKAYKIVNSGNIKVIDRDLRSEEVCDFIWLNIPKLEDMYKKEEMDIEELIKKIDNNRLKYDPAYSYSAVTALGLARCFVKCIALTGKPLDVGNRLKTHFFKFSSDIYNINEINVIPCSFKRENDIENLKREIKEIIEGLKISNL
jgi:hypothetical protein